MSIHDKVNAEDLKTLVSLDVLHQRAVEYVAARARLHPNEYADQATINRHVALLDAAGEQVSTTKQLSILEQIRWRVLQNAPPQQAIPTDVFVFDAGEARDRLSTRVGGLPYRSRSASWPLGDNGKAMLFVGQICFKDSKDITGAIPGDVLLLFVDEDEYCTNDIRNMQFEWYSEGLKELVEEEDIPDIGFRLNPYHASIYRTFDYPDSQQLFSEYRRPYLLSHIEGTKIGGIPRYIQTSQEVLGRFLCTFASLSAVDPYSITALQDPPPLNPDDQYDLAWGDEGCLYIHLNGSMKIEWEIQSY